MHINSVQVINYGPFENFKVNFKPNCLNIIQGLAARGKTQLFGALLIPLLGEKVVLKFKVYMFLMLLFLLQLHTKMLRKQTN